PRLNATSSLAEQHLSDTIKSIPSNIRQVGTGTVSTMAVTGTQTLFNGFRTANQVSQAESQVHAARESRRAVEQTVLLDAATAYMNLWRDTSILELQRNNVRALEGVLAQTRGRFVAFDVTQTDVS